MAKKSICVLACVLMISSVSLASEDCEPSYTEDVFYMLEDIVTAPCQLLAACLGLVGDMVPVGPRYEIVYVTEEVIEEQEIIEKQPPEPVPKETTQIREEPPAPQPSAPTPPPQEPEQEIIVPSPPRPEAPSISEPPTPAPAPQAPDTPEIRERPKKKIKRRTPAKPPCGPVYPYPKGGAYWFMFQ